MPTPKTKPTKQPATYSMDPESINALEIERLRRINAGVPKSLADRSDLVNEAVMARFGKNSQPAA